MSSGSLENVELIEPLPMLRRPSSLRHPESNQNLAENPRQEQMFERDQQNLESSMRNNSPPALRRHNAMLPQNVSINN